MRSIRRGRRRFGPELDEPSYFAVSDREEGDGSVTSHSVRDCYIGDCLRFTANEAIDGETPETVRGILLIHTRKAFRAADALTGLGPLEHEILCQYGSDRVKVVSSHEPPKLTNYFNCARFRHGVSNTDG
jgi:hypothetical protein